MTKADFLKLMHFPEEWLRYDMYPDELFFWQASQYQPGHEDGAEHDRNGAFHWWLRKNPDKTQLERLLRLAAVDPDHQLGEDLRQYFSKAKAFDEELRQLDMALFSSPRDD